MNNAFGYIPEDLLQQADDAWEFKTCQRSDGTTYGTAGDCKQKGAKEAKPKEKEHWADKINREQQEAKNSGQIGLGTLLAGGLQLMKGKSPTAIFTHAPPVADGTLKTNLERVAKTLKAKKK